MINFKTHTLENGIRVVTAPMSSTEATAIQIQVGIGTRFETKEKNGISHFLEHVFFKGSKKYQSFFEITSLLDSLGAGYNASTSYEATKFYIQTSSKDFKKGYDVLVDLFKNPLFPEKELARERGVIVEELKMYLDMPQARAAMMNQAQTFPSHPLGFDIGGTISSVQKINRQDIVNYFKEHYSPENIIISVAGNPKGSDWLEMIKRDFENLPTSPIKPYEPFGENQFQPSVDQKVKDVDQANFFLSFPAIKKPDQRRFAFNLMDVIFGSGASSRLNIELREKRGLGYDIGSGINAFLDCGSFYIYGGVKKENLQKTIDLAQKEALKFAEEGPTDEELKRAKGNIRGQITRQMESSSAIADYLTSSLYTYGEILTIHEMLERYEQVTREDVRKLAKEIFDLKKAVISIVGPKEYKLS